MKNPIDAVIVVRGGEDVRDKQLPATGDDGGIVSKVGVFEQDSGVFFVNADGIFDGLARSGAVHKGRV